MFFSAGAVFVAPGVKTTRAALEHTFALQTAALTDRIAALETANRALEAELTARAVEPSSSDDDDDAFEVRDPGDGAGERADQPDQN